ncbi:1-deoxy-D-xylulose-5-phosphate synthase [bacterium]|nr:1-deoxy-D-xylulose-5-phosphate synthase [bacterium]
MNKKILFSTLIAISVSCGCAFANTDYLNSDYKLQVLNNVNSPKDVKKLSKSQLNLLADDLRYGIINRANTIGGHLGPDLGFVEPTIALHYVFNSPKDKIVFDVSHQIYPHKMLTGRKDGFTDPVNHPEISGYSNQDESEHDYFKVGHTSTSLSLATGMAKARDLKKEKYNVITVIGDGSLSGGEALEGLSNAAVLGSNFIIIVNDNEMAIAENHGGIYTALKELRDTNGKTQNNFFKAMGFDYYYLENGNNTDDLINLFSKVKDTNKPTVVHIHTLKGKGYAPAEENKEKFHYQMNGFLNAKNTKYSENYNSITSDFLLKKAKKDKTLIVVSPATPGATGLTPDVRAKLGDNYVDVGIAEQQAVGFISGAAKNGATPVLEVFSSFIQRSYDQLSQDLALNNNPATILVFGGGISSADMTHLQVFDIPLISNIPNMVYLAPVNKEEYLGMINWATNQKKYPVAIRVPSGAVVSSGKIDKTDYSKLNKFKVEEKGSEIAIIAAGNFFQLGEQVKDKLKEQGINATLINPVYLTGIDEELLNNLKKDHKIVITLESGVLDGGFGEKITRYYGNSNMKVLNYGAKKEFTDRVPLKELYDKYHLTPELIVQDINNIK